MILCCLTTYSVLRSLLDTLLACDYRPIYSFFFSKNSFMLLAALAVFSITASFDFADLDEEQSELQMTLMLRS